MPHHKYRNIKYINGHYVRTGAFRNAKKATRYAPAKSEIPSGFCECRCGGKTPIAKMTRQKFKQFAGYPIRFIKGHNGRLQTGERSANWKGGKTVRRGYVFIHVPGHHLADVAGYAPEHRLVWERTHHRQLGPNMHVHHVDGNPLNNSPKNLVALTQRAHLRGHKGSQTSRKAASDRNNKFYSVPANRKAQSRRMKKWWADRKSSKATP